MENQNFTASVKQQCQNLLGIKQPDGHLLGIPYHIEETMPPNQIRIVDTFRDNVVATIINID